MPTTYAHDIFGKEVFKKLPAEIKDTIRQGKEAYRIGVHGPDIFFYYRPLLKNRVRSHGSGMHAECAADFFVRGIQEYQGKPSLQLASYLLGFACHFMLDSTCHGYINLFEKEKGVSHAEIETELDRRLMLREGKELFVYLPASVTRVDQQNCEVIRRMFPDVTVRQLKEALYSQKFFDRLLTCRCGVKEKVILGGMKVLGCYDELEGQVMRKTVNPVTGESTEKLMGLYQNALEDAPALLENLYRCMTGEETELSVRFHQDYNGKIME